MIGHQLIRAQFGLMNLQRLMQNPLERFKVGVFVKERRTEIAAIEGMGKSARSSARGGQGMACLYNQENPPSSNAPTEQRGLTSLIFRERMV